MTALGPEARALVEAGRDDVVRLSVEERAAVRDKLLAAATAGTALSLTGVVAAKVSLLKATSASTLAVSAALLLGGAGAYYAFSAQHGSAAVGSARAPLTSSVAGTVRAPVPGPLATSDTPPEASTTRADEPPLARDEKQPLARAPALPRARLAAPPAASADTGFVEDARLLREVRAALSSGDKERALSLLDARQAKGGAGVLAEEREAARVVTLCGLGRQAEAQAALRRFLAQHPSSPLSERVRRACATGAPDRRTKGS